MLIVCLLLRAAAPAWADTIYLAPGRPDGVSLLPAPPAVGSAEEAADLASVRAVCLGRTAAEEKRARTDDKLSFDIFAPAIGPVFELGKLPKTQALLERVKKDIGEVIDTSKNHWKRLRPYQMDTHLAVGKPEPSFSYPSGHSTRGTVYALVLAEVFPARQAAILETGRQIGWDRVVFGKHFPTDIYAGRVLGQAIVHELLSSPAFAHDLAEAKGEVAAAIHPTLTEVKSVK